MIVFISEEEKDGENLMSKLYDQLKNSKRIVSFGCSVVFGEELKDIPGRATGETKPSKYSYPALIAEKYTQGKLACYAKSGDGNQSIIRKLIDYVNNDKQPGDFVIVGMSGSVRVEMYNNTINNYATFFPNATTSVKHRKGPIENSFKELSKIYDVMLSYMSEKSIEDNYHTQCCLIQNVLQNNNIPFVVVKSLDADYQNLNRIIYGDMSIMGLAYTGGFGRKEFGHPDEKTHQVFAEKVIDWIKNDVRLANKTEKNILIIAQSRSGGTVVADVLSKYYGLQYVGEKFNTHRYGYEESRFKDSKEYKNYWLEYYKNNTGYLIKASWFDLLEIENQINNDEWDIYHVERTNAAEMVCSSWLSKESNVFHVMPGEKHTPLKNVTVPLDFVNSFVFNSDYGGWFYNIADNLPILEKFNYTKIHYDDSTTVNDILQQCGLEKDSVLQTGVTKLYPSKQKSIANYQEIVDYIRENGTK